MSKLISGGLPWTHCNIFNSLQRFITKLVQFLPPNNLRHLARAIMGNSVTVQLLQLLLTVLAHTGSIANQKLQSLINEWPHWLCAKNILKAKGRVTLKTWMEWEELVTLERNSSLGLSAGRRELKQTVTTEVMSKKVEREETNGSQNWTDKSKWEVTW